MHNKKTLFEDESEEEVDEGWKINEATARRIDHNRRRDMITKLQKDLEAKHGKQNLADSGDGESESSSSDGTEDEDARLLTRKA